MNKCQATCQHKKRPANQPTSSNPALKSPKRKSRARDSEYHLNPYPAYKPSGVEWLGDVPTHWEVRCLGRLGRFFKGGGGTKEDEREFGVPCVRYGDLYTHHQFFITASRTCVSHELAATAYTPLRYGDVLFAGSGETIDEIGKSAVNLIRGSACCGGDVIILRPSIRVDPRFLGYASDCPLSARQKASMGRGFTVMHIYSRELKYMVVAIPPLSEQTVIVEYLDKATAEIAAAIARARRQVELLQEYCTRLIADVVTGRIHVKTGQPYPEYKPSGVEWLSDVPAHWEVRRIKTIFREADNRGGKGPLLSLTRKRGIVPQADIANRPASAENTSKYKQCSPGNIVMNRMQAWSGMFAVSNIDGHISPDYSIFVPVVPSISPPFFESLFRTPLLVGEFARRSKGIGDGFNRLYTPDFSAIKVVTPPLSEQTAIVEYLDKATADMDAAIARARRQVELLQEYRTRLIADVVTGKLAVREAPAPHPGGDRGAEALDETDILNNAEEGTEAMED